MKWIPEDYNDDFQIDTKECKYGNRRCCICEKILKRDENYLCKKCSEKE